MGTVAALLLFLAGAAVAPQPHVVFLCNEDEYRARNTLPAFARDLREKFGCRCTVLIGKGDDGFKSLEALKSADTLVIFVRRRALPKEQLDAIRAYCDAGKPVVGLRTASHAFAKKTKTPAGHAQWPEFDRDVLGGNYHNHGKSATEVSLAPNAAGHPLLAGIDPKKWTSKSTLYFASPLDKKAHALLLGSSEGKTEPVAWTHAYKGGRVFYTSLGHQDDFAAPQFRTLLVNAIFWSMDRPLPDGKKAEKGAKSMQNSASPPLKFTVSKETTFLTEPLRPDGSVDYLRAMNERLSQGVTPENNAAVDLVQALGPGCISEKSRKGRLACLGLADLPEKGDYLISLHDFMTAYHPQKDLKGNHIGEKWEDAFFSQESFAATHPWSKAEYPLLAAWIEANEAPYRILTNGSHKTHYYIPLVDEKGTNPLGAAVASSIMEIRDVLRLLLLRSMYELHAGHLEKAWQDILAGYRWAGLQSQGPLTLDRLIAIGLENIADSALRNLVGSQKLTGEQAARFLQDLDRLPPWPSEKEIFNYGERFYALDLFQYISIHGYDSPPSVFTLPDGEKIPSPFESTDRAIKRLADDPRLDWNEAFRYFNSRHDRILQAWKCPDSEEKRELLKAFQYDFSASREKDMKTIMDEKYSATATPTMLARHLVEMGGWQISEMSQLEQGEFRRKATFDICRLALAMAAYYGELNAYPQTLAELCPKYIATLPIDPFSDKSLIYKSENEGYLLYSVGPNRIDDGGRNFTAEHETAEEFQRATPEELAWDDIAIRMPPKHSTK